MSTVEIPCDLEVNGERMVHGTVKFESCSGADIITVECPAEFPEALVLEFLPHQCEELREFFGNADILSWKITFSDRSTNVDSAVVLIFSREPGLVLHLSIAAGLSSRHFETPLPVASLDLERFFS